MQSLTPFTTMMILFVIVMIAITMLTKFFQKEGLYLYMIVAVIAGNIQVLKAVEIYPFSYPIPLGNVLFTSLFLVSDILTERYGKNEAKKAIWVGFAAALLFSIIMIVTIGIRPLSSQNEHHQLFIQAHRSMTFLFTPSISIMIASLIAYITSLWFDVTIFYAIKKITKERFVWLRVFISSFLGIVLDNIIFSLLAWRVLAVAPVDSDIVVSSYIIGSLAIRLLLSLLSIPIFYLILKQFRTKLAAI
jgi:uncharacterized integral membrane protein (TIGR00697 family)